MSYIEGKPITYYEKNHHVQNKIIARVGASAFFEMLMVHNFIHADCHGGNIYVTLKKREHTFYKYIKFQWDWFKTYLWSKIIRSMLDTKILQKLADDHLEEEKILKK